jgi:tRNA(Arg) A34 adenosine deaminase TadA
VLLLPAPARAARNQFSRRAMQLRDEAVRARDPTAHAEMEAIRHAARTLGTRDLSGCDLYGSSPACRMCEAAAYWAGIARLFHGEDASGGRPPQL